MCRVTVPPCDALRRDQECTETSKIQPEPQSWASALFLQFMNTQTIELASEGMMKLIYACDAVFKCSHINLRVLECVIKPLLWDVLPTVKSSVNELSEGGC